MTSTSSTVSPTEHQPRRWYQQRRRWIGIIGWELLHAVLWLPQFLLLIPSILLFHLTVPLGATLERIVARALGVDAPSGRREGERKTPWLLARVAHVEFWRQDLPLCLGGLALSTASFFSAAVLGSMALTGILAPFITSPENPGRFYMGGIEVTVTGPGTGWPLVPVGLVCLALAVGALLGFGILRLLLVEVLSGERRRQRLEQLTAEVGHLTASRATLMDAFEAERTRIERDLHDGAQQDLVALAMSLGGLRLAAESLPDDDATAASRTTLLEGIDAAQDRAEAALRDLRETVHGIRPAVLSERGLAPALRDLAGRAPLPTSVVVDAEEADLARISQPVATVVYFAVTEALTNAAKHARAERAAVALRCAGAGLSAVVTDDGRGGADPGRENATGLRGMAQRVESIGGYLEVSSPDGNGTRLTITAPLTPPWGAGGLEDEQVKDAEDGQPDNRPHEQGDHQEADREADTAGGSAADTVGDTVGQEARPGTLTPAATSAPV
ncbi:sensor histidine kinase [Actinomyces sp. ZJ308]|uniref:sensor histidine kinase n=1 Tax=Actinomyces sp. ZJ308 TaxID=2708342 RepID=UPI001AB02F2C|nr:sensor histidine kinase [Actinomyces sp. ZJ308]